MTREYIKSEIDILPDSAFETFEKMFSAFFDYVEKTKIANDHFWSDENQNYLSKVISDYENGVKKPVIKTMEELEAYE
jgi:hypothetical protein